MAMDTVLNKLRNLDAYPKINEDFYSRTLSGGVITLVSSLAMLLLFVSEFSMHLLFSLFFFFFLKPFYLLSLFDFVTDINQLNLRSLHSTMLGFSLSEIV